MKYKKLKRYLENKQAWWDRLPQNVKNATTKPGSIKTR